MTFGELKELWRVEIMGPASRFSWWKLFRRTRQYSKYRFLFSFRLAQYLNGKRGRLSRKVAFSMHQGMIERFSIDIALAARIGQGLCVVHPVGIVITDKAVIGKNFSLFQNVTIGQKDDNSRPIIIGDNVSVCANACIIGDGIRIGSGSVIGAAAFINTDVPDSCIAYSKADLVIRPIGDEYPVDSEVTRRMKAAG